MVKLYNIALPSKHSVEYIILYSLQKISGQRVRINTNLQQLLLEFGLFGYYN